MWRGQGDLDWPIHSSAYRRISSPSEGKLASYEQRLLEQATHNGYRFLDGRELSDMELLARLQHHGAATRLIDTSKSVLVALWFCCVSEPNKTGALIGVHTDHLGGYEGETDRRKYQEVIKGLKGVPHPLTWEPPSITKRIAAQHSQFLYSEVKKDKWGNLALPRDKGATYIFAIPSTLKTKCIEILQEAFDIRHLTLFPDLDGFGQANSHNKYEFYNNRW
ncbi:FRG domain-containing protein [Methylobacter sp. Wu8]|uniref:FRG domain-containing protein n=1 Tax=Methylobacter sp. Wu8 TaxID=3118457 RepID=UPI002F2DD548